MMREPQDFWIDTYGDRFEPPAFTIKQLREVIPPHCFDRSTFWGLYYVVRDLSFLASVFIVFHHCLTPAYIQSGLARCSLWALYSFIQGLFGTGLWVLGHECGHQALSPVGFVNDLVGCLCHSLLLVPYFSWKISHQQHHHNNGHLVKDPTFVPKTREQYASMIGMAVEEVAHLTEDAPAKTLLNLFLQQLLGWPLYLLADASSHHWHKPDDEEDGDGGVKKWLRARNHFNPYSPIFLPSQAGLVLFSDLIVLSMVFLLYVIGKKFGWANLLVWYGLPYLWVNNWLVAVTYLQHTDPCLPRYSPGAWSFTRGAAVTIDRDLGFIGRHIFHAITDTHVLHHFFSRIPFYHAEEANAAIRPVMGKSYRSSPHAGPVGFVRSIWSVARMCQWVESSDPTTPRDEQILFFRNRNNIGAPPAA